MDDAGIVELYWQRSERAVSETAAKYGAYCMKISHNILGDLQESEENVNDTYLQAWNSMPPHRPDTLSPFLGKIARNLALNRYKAGHALKRGAGEFALSLDELGECVPMGRSAEEITDAAALGHSISAFLRGESAEARRIFIRRYFYSESVDEIARRFAVSESKVKSILFRTRNKLRIHLEKEGWSHEI